MAFVNKFQRGKAAPTPATRATKIVTLPTKKSVANLNMIDYRYILFGERGIGKSTLADKIFDGNALFCMFEPDEDLEVYKMQIPDWETFEAVIDKVVEDREKGKCIYNGIVVDNGQVAYKMAMTYAGKIGGFEHPGGMDDYGASWDKVTTAFRRPFAKLMAIDLGLIVVCHVQQKEVTSFTGRKYHQIMPDWSNQADQYLGATVNNIFYYHYVGSDRYLTLTGDDLVVAKVKIKRHFFTPSGQRVCRIPMGETLDQAHNNFVKAFNNQQRDTFAKVVDREALKYKSKASESVQSNEQSAAPATRKLVLRKQS